MPFQRVLVPINGTANDEHAMRIAINLTRRSRAAIYVIYVVEVKLALPLDAQLPAEVAHGEAAIQRCEAVCQAENVSIEAELLQARDASAAIVDEAAQRQIDVIIMAAGGRIRRGEFTLGHTVPYVLRHAACEVWLVRRPFAGR